MKHVVNSKFLKNYAILTVFLLVIEVIFKIISKISFDVSIIRIIIGANIFGILLSFLLSWLPRIAGNIITIIICLICTVYSFFQIGFNIIIGVYASVNSTSQLGAVVDYIIDFFRAYPWTSYLMFVPFILLVLYYIFLDKKLSLKLENIFDGAKRFKYEKLTRSGISIVALVLLCLLYYGTLNFKFMQNELQTVSNKELFHYPRVSSIAVNQFGVITYGILDVKTLGMEIPESVVKRPTHKEEKPVTEASRTIDDTIWKRVIEKEKNSTLKDIDEYLINSNITDYNDHTGLLKGKNLIVLMLESVNEIIIDKDLYPNFYKLYSEGISFKNNYSPRNNCSTGNNEFSGMVGLYTIQGNCTSNRFMYNEYSTSLFNLFNRAGYKTTSMHNYTEQYYYRRTIHKNMGSGKFYGVEDLGIKYYNYYKDWSSDEDFANVAMDLTLKDTSEPFMLWMTTVSSHQPYGVSSIEGDKYLDITKDKNYPMDIRRYMSKLKTLDNALGILLDRLEEAGILDDTVIAMYADHYPYAIKASALNYVLDYDLDEYEIERTPMVIYNSSLKPEVVLKYNSYINFTPTLANLFDLDYDPRLYVGEDVFSDDYLDLVIFDDGSWKNSIAYYNASNASIKYYTDKELTVDEIKEINNIITLRRQYSVSIIKSNFFKHLDDSLKKEKELYEAEQNSIIDENGSNNIIEETE